MKKAVIMALSFLALYSAAAQGRNLQHLVGRWEAVSSDNASGGLEIIDSSKLFIVYGPQKKAIVSYHFDFTKSPAWFDFTVKDSTETFTLKSLIQFINDDLIQWQVFDGSTQPVYFATDAGDMVFLRRKK